jgi:hypothetical protein
MDFYKHNCTVAFDVGSQKYKNLLLLAVFSGTALTQKISQEQIYGTNEQNSMVSDLC